MLYKENRERQKECNNVISKELQCTMIKINIDEYYKEKEVLSVMNEIDIACLMNMKTNIIAHSSTFFTEEKRLMYRVDA